MKKQLLILCCFAALTFSTLPVQAATIASPVAFYLIDTDHDGSVTINITGNWPFDLNLDWSYDGSNWFDWSPALMNFDTTAESYCGVIYLSIVENWVRDTVGDTIFDGGGVAGNDGWYRSVFIKWSDAPQLSFLTAQPNDAVSPTPIANAALLLGSGVFGLVMVMARKRN
ncbi:MAG: hypothetical protein ABIK15_13615 [Pseudomonadota bacterium]